MQAHVRAIIRNADLAATHHAWPPRAAYFIDESHVWDRKTEPNILDQLLTIPWKDPAPRSPALTMQMMQDAICLIWGGHCETYLDLHGDERCTRCGAVEPWVLGSE